MQIHELVLLASKDLVDTGRTVEAGRIGNRVLVRVHETLAQPVTKQHIVRAAGPGETRAAAAARCARLAARARRVEMAARARPRHLVHGGRRAQRINERRLARSARGQTAEHARPVEHGAVPSLALELALTLLDG